MAEHEAAQVDEEATNDAAQVDEEAGTNDAAQGDEEAGTNAAAEVDSGEADMADAVDNRAAELTGATGADPDAPIAEVNRGALDAAEQHLDDANLSDDRETLKKLQQGM